MTHLAPVVAPVYALVLTSVLRASWSMHGTPHPAYRTAPCQWPCRRPPRCPHGQNGGPGLPSWVPGWERCGERVPGRFFAGCGVAEGSTKPIIQPQAPNGHYSLGDMGARYPISHGPGVRVRYILALLLASFRMVFPLVFRELWPVLTPLSCKVPWFSENYGQY